MLNSVEHEKNIYNLGAWFKSKDVLLNLPERTSFNVLMTLVSHTYTKPIFLCERLEYVTNVDAEDEYENLHWKYICDPIYVSILYRSCC